MLFIGRLIEVNLSQNFYSATTLNRCYLFIIISFFVDSVKYTVS